MKPLQTLPKGVSLCVSLTHLPKTKALQLIEKKGFKIWISILSDHKKLGFRFVRNSVAKNYKFTSEFRHHIVKPTFDDKKKKKKAIQSFSGKTGSFIVFNDELLHAGEVVDSKKCRFSLEFTFCFKKKLN